MKFHPDLLQVEYAKQRVMQVIQEEREKLNGMGGGRLDNDILPGVYKVPYNLIFPPHHLLKTLFSFITFSPPSPFPHLIFLITA